MNRLIQIVVAGLCIFVGGITTAADDVLIADFESEDYGAWQVEGEAFGPGPAKGTLPGQMPVEGFRGSRLVNSFYEGDGTTGTLTSPPFTINRAYINFLIGGGAHEGETCMNLLVDGEVVRTATGSNNQPGGSEFLDWWSWDVKELQDETARLQIVDRHTGGWGHINVDQIFLSDKAAQATVEDRTRSLVLDEKYLLFPIDNEARSCRLKISVDGQLVQNFDINLAVKEVDWWAKLDMSAHKGQTAVLNVSRLPSDSQGLAMIETAATLDRLRPFYDQSLRPQLRFSQLRGWNNDPNGMVFYDGEYHLCWQSNPFGPQWANMFWGHAVSKDLVHWTELPLALYPRTMAKDKCFSGSGQVDVQNTGGWQTGDEEVLIAAFTDTGAGEALALSQDRGRTWVYPDFNPIIRHQGRDPKLIWYEPGQHWVIAVYSEVQGEHTIAFYVSTDLKKWELTSRIGGYFECPELFELPVDGDSENTRWVLFGADAAYQVGSFDGRQFKPEHAEKRRVHFGSYYASQCFSRVPDGRVIQVGWARIEMPGMPFNQAFSLPTELTLQSSPEGIRLHCKPINELERLRGTPTRIEARPLVAGEPLTVPMDGQLYDVTLEVEPGDAERIVVKFGDNTLAYDVRAQQLDEMPLPLQAGKLRLRVIMDRPMYELVGGDGRVYRTVSRKDGGRPLREFSVTAEGGPAELTACIVHPMRSIWPEEKK